MTAHLLDALYGLVGGLLPGGLHLAWNITRGTKVNSGNIDLTLRTPLPIKVTPVQPPEETK